MIGTLEHFTNPWSIISKIKNMLKNSKFIFTVPNYINPRGLVLLTIKELFNKKISKSDIFFFTPDIIKKELKKLKFKNISIKTIKSDETYGDIAFQDLKQRLPKVLGNNKLMKINLLLKYFKIYSKTYFKNDYSGRIFLCKLKKNKNMIYVYLIIENANRELHSRALLISEILKKFKKKNYNCYR